MPGASAFARSTRDGVKAGGRFMTSRELREAAQPLGVNRATLYFRGRAGAMGDVSPLVATAVFGMFPNWVVDMAWEQSRDLSPNTAVRAYSEACWAWGRAHLAALPGPQRLAQLAERIVDAAEPSALPLFAGWRAQDRPEDAPARAAHAVALLRELRGGLHFAALRAHGLDVPLAVLAEPSAVPSQLAKTGWTDEQIAVLAERARTVADLQPRWRRAEDDTDTAFGAFVDVLSGAERTELSEHLGSFEQLSRPAATTDPPPAA